MLHERSFCLERSQDHRLSWPREGQGEEEEVEDMEGGTEEVSADAPSSESSSLACQQLAHGKT